MNEFRRVQLGFLSAFLAMTCVMAFPATVFAVDVGQIQRWLDEEWALASKGIDLPLGRLDYHQERTLRLPDAQVAEMRSRVAGRPDHPDRHILKEIDRQIAGGPDVTEYSIWWKAPGQWRYNKTPHYTNSAGFADIAVRSSVSWCLTPTQLNLSSSESPVAGYNYVENEPTIEHAYKTHRFAGLGDKHGIGITRTPVQLEGDGSWVFYLERPGMFRFRVTGHWDDSAKRGFVDSRRVESSTTDFYPVGRDIRFQKWSQYAGLWMATIVEWAGTPSLATHEVNRSVIDSYSPVTDEQFDALTAIPSFDSKDVVRGALTIDSIADHRPQSNQYTSRPSPLVAPISQDLNEHVSTTWIEVSGWVLFLGFAIAIVVIRVRKS